MKREDIKRIKDMHKFTPKLEATEKNGKAIVYLYGDVVDERPTDWWTGAQIEGDFIIPADVRNLFDGVTSDEIDVHINSYGGSAFAGVAVHNYIKNLEKTINIFVDGIAASAASIIAMAGNTLTMPTNSLLMIHRSSSYGWGNCNDLRKLADTLEKLDNSVGLESYKAKFKGTDEELIALLDAETWISAEEAKAYGLCDTVLKAEEKKTAEEPTNEEISNAIKFMTNFSKLKM